MVRNVARERSVTPGHTVVYPNREKSASKVTKLIVSVILLVSAAILLILTVGGWSKFQGLKAVNIIWAAIYVLMAFYIMTRWARGLLPMAAGLAILLLITALVAGTGVSGASWFDRSHFGFAPADSIFGSTGLSADVLGFFTILLVPVQALLLFFAMMGFSQGWNVETEMPIDEAEKRGEKGDKEDKKDKSSSAQPATA
jgi:signal transduction histidine kinase